MTDDKEPGKKGPKDRFLDLLVFGPAGLAMTAAEEFPKLVEKGRHRVEGQVHTARLVGQFAVQMGRKQIEDTVEGVLGRNRQPARSHVPPPAPAPPPPAPSPATPKATTPPPAPREGTTPPNTNGSMGSTVLGIPGYDSLSASQVVQRLGGLSAPELEAVQAHELAHRHRRTILNRVEQLLAGADTAGA